MCPVSGCEALTEWEYLPPVGPRPTKGFVGLKNAGATCYMNSVIQQLYMIPPIRNGLLAIDGTGSDIDDDLSGDEKQDNEVKHTHTRVTRPYRNPLPRVGNQKSIPITESDTWCKNSNFNSCVRSFLNHSFNRFIQKHCLTTAVVVFFVWQW